MDFIKSEKNDSIPYLQNRHIGRFYRDLLVRLSVRLNHDNIGGFIQNLTSVNIFRDHIVLLIFLCQRISTFIYSHVQALEVSFFALNLFLFFKQEPKR